MSILDKNSNDLTDDRDKMKDYWVKHSQFASMEEMLLDSNAETISDTELPEILSFLPSFKDQVLLELGAGIGRFTSVLAEQAKHVTAVDFIEKFTKKSEELNARFNNITYITDDVTKMKFESDKFDTIFSNWLLMYLKDSELEKFVTNSLTSIKEGGYIFFRESCFHASGNIKKCENPTEYRSPTKYVEYFQSETIEKDGDKYGFELVFARPNRTYIELKNNGNQVCFLFQKVKLENHHGFKTLKEFFDECQYSTNSILRYEKIFGKGYISTGGQETTELFLKRLDLKPNQRVLDIGCGVGGGDFLMSQLYNVEVFGLDLSSNMVCMCWDRSQDYKNHKARFEIGDVTKHEYPYGYFDVIYSRDSFLHVSDKEKNFKRFYNWLKPGGKLFLTDYTCGEKPWSNEFEEYVSVRGYDLLTINEYEALMKNTEFINVKCEDMTDLFLSYLYKESDKFKSIRSEFVSEFSAEEHDIILEGWNEKIKRCKLGYQKWGVVYAEKKL